MNLNKILAELRQEREQIDEAIVSLERLAAGCFAAMGEKVRAILSHAIRLRLNQRAKIALNQFFRENGGRV